MIVKKSASMLLLLAFVFFVVAGCGNSSIEVDMEIPTYMEEDAELPVVFQVMENGEPVTGVEVEAIFEMPGMDCESPHAVFTEEEPGVYTGEVAFSMPGEWMAIVEINNEEISVEKLLEFYMEGM